MFRVWRSTVAVRPGSRCGGGALVSESGFRLLEITNEKAIENLGGDLSNEVHSWQ